MNSNTYARRVFTEGSQACEVDIQLMPLGCDLVVYVKISPKAELREWSSQRCAYYAHRRR